MNKKIFRSIWMVTLSVLFVCLGIIMAALSSYYTEEQFEMLRSETVLTARGVTLNGADYFTSLDTSGFRITWITPDGKILYDSAADHAVMENHLEREEIQKALSEGYGESHRYSSTLSERQLYTAMRLNDGSVLRLSVTQATIWKLFMRFSLPLLAVLLAALGASFYLASRLANRIVKPFNELDLDHPLKNAHKEDYAEIRPLLQRLNDQYAQLQIDREELERNSLIRQEFTANASHELKTPLHVISGYAELLENGMVKEQDIPAFAEKIRSESQRMTKLVEDIIELSKLDAGDTDAKKERIDVCRVAQNAVESLESSAEEAGISVTLQGSPSFILGVPHILYSIVYNLLNNAIKYSDSGSDVLVSVNPARGKVILSVKDHGIGIPEEDLSRIFERFYRVDKSRSKDVGGTGLGLSIVKHAARIHGAELYVESTLGKGSVFTVEFPAA